MTPMLQRLPVSVLSIFTFKEVITYALALERGGDEALQQVMRKGHIAHRQQDSKTHLADLASAVEKAFAELDKNSDGRIEKSEAFTKDEPKKEHSADDAFVQRKGGLWMTRRQELQARARIKLLWIWQIAWLLLMGLFCLGLVPCYFA